MQAELHWKSLRLRQPKVRPDELLNYFDIQEPAVPVESILRGLGIKVQSMNLFEFAGEVISTEDDAQILVNSEDAHVRRRFTMAHECGHLLWHPNKNHFRDASADFGGFSHLEVEANQFAADLLMPPWLIWPAVGRFGKNVDRLAAIFDVSTAAMSYRLRVLEVP